MSKPILIEGAMKVETAHIIAQLNDVSETVMGQWHYFAGTYRGLNIVVAQTHWGVANAAAVTALAMERFAPLAVISQGTAGGHDPSLKTRDLIIGTKTVNQSAWKSKYTPQGGGANYRDINKLGVFAYDKTQKKFTQEVYHACDEKIVAAALSIKNSYTQGNVVSGILGTADSWNTQIDRILFLHEFYGSLAEEMEGDAVAQICQTYDTPFADIRVLSNTVFEGDRDWDTSVGEACQQCVLDTAAKYAENMRQ